MFLCFCSRLCINCFYCLNIKMSKYQYVFFAAPMLRCIYIDISIYIDIYKPINKCSLLLFFVNIKPAIHNVLSVVQVVQVVTAVGKMSV